MAVIRVAGFSGANQAIHPKLLPDAVGVNSLNQKPGRGDLRPWKDPLAVASVPAGRKTIYRMNRATPSDSAYWFSWPGVVHAVKSFDPDDATELTFFTGDGQPKYTTLTANASSGSGPYPVASTVFNLGVPAPAIAPTVVGTYADSSIGLPGFKFKSYRYYTYTYVTALGWESQASPVSAGAGEVEGGYTQYYTISNIQAPPAGYNITKMRFYMTAGTLTGDSQFFFIREVNVGATSIQHQWTDGFLGETLATKTWAPPPTNLTYLTPMWNGMLAGLADGAVRFCEPYVPYSWPLSNDVLPPDSKPVALGVYGQNLLVLTTNRPLLVSGSSPDALDQQLLEVPQGCVSARSAVSMGTGVVWSSNDGLCWYGSGGPKLITAGIMTRDDWQALVPSSIIGQMYEGLYLGSYSTDGGVTRKGFFIDPMNPTGIYFMSKGYEAMYFDELIDQLYVLEGTSVKKWDAGATSMQVSFTSREFRLGRPTQAFSCGEVIANTYPVTVKVDAKEMSSSEVTAIVAKYPGYATALDATTLRFTASVSSAAPFRLPGGFSAQTWQITVEASTPVQGVALAHSFEELAQT